MDVCHGIEPIYDVTNPASARFEPDACNRLLLKISVTGYTTETLGLENMF